MTPTLGLLVSSLAFGPVEAPARIDVYIAGRDGYHTYRIPALITSPKGTLLAFCEGRKDDGRDRGDIDLLLKRSTDDGRTWGPAQIVYEEGGAKKITIGNPCPVVDRSTGTIWLPFCRDNEDVLVTHSNDDGKTWAKPTDITRQVKAEGWTWYATGPGVGIQLGQGPHAGRLVIPCDHREKADAREVQHSHVFYSDDHGKSWNLGATVGPHTDECQVVEAAGGSLVINMRNYYGRTGKQPENGNVRAIATSTDGGATWSAVRFDRTLIEPVCQASFLRYTDARRHDKNRVLFSNPATRKDRVRMTVRLSYDEGRTWPVAKVLWSGPSAYSCLTVLPDLSIGCLYERGDRHAYESIRFARFSLAWLTDGKDVPARR